MLLWFKLRLNVIVIWEFSSSDLWISIERIVGFPSKDQWIHLQCLAATIAFGDVMPVFHNGRACTG